jgi:hypothetical protein
MDPDTRPPSQVLDDLVAKLETMGPHHPDRPTLIRMILDLRREIDRRPAPDHTPATAEHRPPADDHPRGHS